MFETHIRVAYFPTAGDMTVSHDLYSLRKITLETRGFKLRHNPSKTSFLPKQQVTLVITDD